MEWKLTIQGIYGPCNKAFYWVNVKIWTSRKLYCKWTGNGNRDYLVTTIALCTPCSRAKTLRHWVFRSLRAAYSVVSLQILTIQTHPSFYVYPHYLQVSWESDHKQPRKIGSSFEQTMMDWSPSCYIPSCVEIGPPVPEKKIFEGFLLYMGVAILVMWPGCREQTFVPPTQGGST